MRLRSIMTSDFSRVWELPFEHLLKVKITALNIIAYFKAIESRFKDISEDFRKTGIPSDENEVYKIANLWILIFDFVHQEDVEYKVMTPLGDMAIKRYDNMMDAYKYYMKCMAEKDFRLYTQDDCEKRFTNYYNAINDYAEKVRESLQYQREQLETRFGN